MYSDYEGHKAVSEIGACNVYRADPSTGETTVVADGFRRPNGSSVFSADEAIKLYIVDTRQKHIRRFDVENEVRLTGGEVFATCDAGSFDGIRLDEAGSDLGGGS